MNKIIHVKKKCTSAIPLSLLLLGLLIGGFSTATAQTADQPAGLKLLWGSHDYDGDLGNELTEVPVYDFLYGAGLAVYLSPRWETSLDLQWMTLDADNDENDRYPARRGTSFDTHNLNASLMARWKPFRTRLNPYLAAGFGVNVLRDGAQVARDDTRLAASVPLGLGVNYELTDQFMLNLQATYHRTFSDALDFHPLSAGDTAPDVEARPDFDGRDHDDFLTTSVGLVFNFGGGPMDEGDEHRRLLRQSMENLKAVEATAEEATQTLRDAQQVNEQTAVALDSLRDATGQSRRESAKLKAEVGRIVNNMQFEFDSAEIIAPAYDELNALAALLHAYPGLGLHIEGRADQRGPDGYNKTLSRERVEAVKEYLVGQGVDTDRITTTAMGEEAPVMSSDTETARGQNRSVRMTLRYTSSH